MGVRILVAVLATLVAASVTAQSIVGDTSSPVAGPPAPTSASVTRDERGRAAVRAVRLIEPLRVDGRLDEAVYRTVPPIDGFLQQVPQEGAPATEPTEMWVLFDDENVYVAARCLDSQPVRITANELRRDSNAIFQNDNFGVVLDTFFDQRNGYYFQTNAIGALRDAAVNESRNNSNWSTVWDVRAARFEHGYTVEMVIPFKSLRYRGAGPQTWGINARRVVAWKNESSMLSQVPASKDELFKHPMAELVPSPPRLDGDPKKVEVEVSASNLTEISLKVTGELFPSAQVFAGPVVLQHSPSWAVTSGGGRDWRRTSFLRHQGLRARLDWHRVRGRRGFGDRNRLQLLRGLRRVRTRAQGRCAFLARGQLLDSQGSGRLQIDGRWCELRRPTH